MSPALYYTLARYLIAWACGALVQRGWTVANLDGATIDAVTQLSVGVAGLLLTGGIGALTTSVRWTVARMKRHHPVELVVAAHEVIAAPKPEGAP